MPGSRGPTPESRVLRSLYAWLSLHRVFHWRVNTGAYKHPESGQYIRYGLPGCSDILGITRGGTGRLLAIEAKATSGLSAQQQRFKERIEENGGLYIVARSVDDLEARRREILDG